jgi:hypothetical protein
MIMKKTPIFITCIILIFLLSSCSNPTTISTQTQISPSEKTAQYPSSEQTSQYPAPQNGITGNPSYPYPMSTPAIVENPLPTNTSDPKMGNVIGRLILNNNPVKNTTLYLADVIKDATGRDVVAGLDRVKSPNTTTDNKGTFGFINIKPGSYALILDAVTNQYLMKYPGNNKAIIVQVEIGKDVDLGELNYDTLPLP